MCQLHGCHFASPVISTGKDHFNFRMYDAEESLCFTDNKNETLFVLMGVLSVPDSPSSLYILPSPSAFGRTSTSGFHLLPSEAPAHVFASFNIFTNSASKT